MASIVMNYSVFLENSWMILFDVLDVNEVNNYMDIPGEVFWLPAK